LLEGENGGPYGFPFDVGDGPPHLMASLGRRESGGGLGGGRMALDVAAWWFVDGFASAVSLVLVGGLPMLLLFWLMGSVPRD